MLIPLRATALAIVGIGLTPIFRSQLPLSQKIAKRIIAPNTEGMIAVSDR